MPRYRQPRRPRATTTRPAAKIATAAAFAHEPIAPGFVRPSNRFDPLSLAATGLPSSASRGASDSGSAAILFLALRHTAFRAYRSRAAIPRQQADPLPTPLRVVARVCAAPPAPYVARPRTATPPPNRSPESFVPARQESETSPEMRLPHPDDAAAPESKSSTPTAHAAPQSGQKRRDRGAARTAS